MVWSWPPHSDGHDPVEWVFEFGRFDRERWRKNWNSLFDDYDLIHNNHKTVKIEVPGEDFPWKGRVCKIYTSCQMETGRLSSRQEQCVILLGLMKKNNSSIGYHL